MSAIIDAFKIKPFDLEPIYAEWSSPPIFIGNPKKDPSVDDWLAQIKAGCLERKVPKECWHKVAQHNLGPAAKQRFDEIKLVMGKVHGGNYRWNWKRFKVAMNNMGWDIDPKKTEAIKVASKPSGMWWVVGKEKEKTPTQTPTPVPTPERKKVERRGSMPPPAANKALPSTPAPPPPSRASSFLTPRRRDSSQSVVSVAASPSPDATPGGTVTTVQQVPVWLLNACNALEFMAVEHPQVMTTLSAVLITVGSLPAIPALAGGAGGAILASHAVQAAGAIAVGLGNWLKVAKDNAAQREQLNPNSGSIEASIEA